MTLLEKLGLNGPYSKLSKEDKRLYQREYRKINPPKRKPVSADERSRLWRNYTSKPGVKEKLKRKQYERYWEDPERHRKASRDWASANKDKIKLSWKRWYAENRQHNLERSRAYAVENRERLNAWALVRNKKRYWSDPSYRIMVRLRSRLGEVCRKQGTRSTSLSLNSDELRAHLESHWLEGMSWDNYGSEWHIDHKIPCSVFDLSDPDQVKTCFSLENLQPMWASDNIRKSNKILPEHEELVEAFQPAELAQSA